MLQNDFSLILRDLRRLYEIIDQSPTPEYYDFLNELVHLYIHALKELACD
ncbi:hypothetical protein SAMN05421677_12538 [Halobacillus aidingensis]|uniref:Uncharacterized protein n=1 Tax=Halobacillus aidingensis TaxID=240303 RepID=A0A1H0UCE0_HALAD|nr:hypothetical protein SAMN05421677_12538 [Halobacillus aidingensis]